MGVLSVLEAAVADHPEGAGPGIPGPAPDARRLRLVRQAATPDPIGEDVVAPDKTEPRSCSISDGVALTQLSAAVLTPSAVIPPRPVRARTQVSSPPLRLTRRGRVVVAALAVTVIAAIAVVIGLAAAGGAQAANHGQPRAGYRGMHEIVVRPGQTLWSIASAAEPGADPRDVVQQIMTANAMTATTITTGQLLWVPR
jgi:LysM domain